MQSCNFKKIRIFFFLIFISFNNQLISQLELGIKGGLGFNSGQNLNYFFESENRSHNLFETNNGLHIGFYTKMKVFNSFFIQPEVYYSLIKRKYDITFPLDHEKYVVDKYQQNRIILPLLFGIELIDWASLYVGPNFSLNSKVFFEQNKQEIAIDNLYEKSEIYLQYGLSLKFKKIIVGLRIERGFEDKEIKVVEKIIDDINQIVKSEGFLTMISLGYQF